MSNKRKLACLLFLCLIFLFILFGLDRVRSDSHTRQVEITLQDYLSQTDEEWFLTGKKEYKVEAMMVSKETSFHNDYENVDYTVSDDNETVIIKGTAGEMWASKISKVIDTYTKPDGSSLKEDDFSKKDVYIDLLAKASPDSCYAMFVNKDINVTVETAWGDMLHTNVLNIPHDEGDYLVCCKGADGKPDLADVWVVNGEIFKNTYYPKNSN